MHFLKDLQKISEHKLSRRNFLKLGILTTASSLYPSVSPAYFRYPVPHEKTLSFYNIHTGETLSTVYWTEGEYLQEALNDINYILRDYRTDEITPIDTGLLDLLHKIYTALNTEQSYHIVSGYRSPSTNFFLYTHSTGVDKNSLHIYGKAVDVRIPYRDLSALRKAAINQKGGGVGYYPDSGFVHIDVGKIQYW